eukprot:UC1_evm1s416
MLKFDESVSDSVNTGLITVYPNADAKAGEGVVLDSSIAEYPTDHSGKSIVMIRLSNDNLFAILLRTDLAIGTSSTYIKIEANAIVDVSPAANAIANTLVKAAGHVADATGPQLLNFGIDMLAGVIIFNFNEPVIAADVDVSQVTLGNGNAQSPTSYPLKAGIPTQTNGLQVTVSLSLADQNEIKLREDLCTSTSDCKIQSATSAFAKDMTSNLFRYLAQVDSTSFVEDTKRPQLSSYNINMNTLEVSLVFPETMDRTSLTFGSITLLKSAAAKTSTAHHTLTGGTLVTQVDATTIVFKMKQDDANEIKRLRICADKDSCFLDMEETAIVDQNNQKVVALVAGTTSRR